jgi:hypothetical protein
VSQSQSRAARLAPDALEARAVPSATVVETFRPLTFTLQGTIATETTTVPAGDQSGETDPDKPTSPPASTPAPDKYDGAFTARGTIDYTSATAGTSGTVDVTGSGRGTTGVGSYTNTFRGTVTLADDGGAWTAVEPFTGTETWTSGRGSTTEPIGPVGGGGTFDPTKYTFASTWDTTADGKTTRGEVRGTVLQTGTAKTDLAITDATAVAAADGTISVSVEGAVTGQLMKAAAGGTAATHLVAEWVTADGTEEAARAAVSWNAGEITADFTGLQPPEGATKLVVRIDAGNEVSEADERNNTWEVELASLTPTAPPTDTPTARFTGPVKLGS